MIRVALICGGIRPIAATCFAITTGIILGTGWAPGTLALSVDDFKALEERILRAVDMVKRERLARAAAEERATKAEAQLHEHGPRFEQLEKDLQALKGEREHVRQRVERLLAQLDTLEL